MPWLVLGLGALLALLAVVVWAARSVKSTDLTEEKQHDLVTV